MLDRLISSTRAILVCAGTITGLHVQSAGFFVHGSELYNNMGIFQSSASARTNDLPTKRPNSCTKVCRASTTPAVGPLRPLFVFSLAHSMTSECGGMHTESVVSAKHSVAAWNRCSCMVSYPPPDNVPPTRSRINGNLDASPRISIPRIAWQFKSTTNASMLISNPCTDNSKLHIPWTRMSDLLAASSSMCMALIGVNIALLSNNVS